MISLQQRGYKLLTMQIKLFTEFNDDLKSHWTSFENECYLYPFQSFEWQRYWYEKVGKPKYNFSLCIIVCRVDYKVRAIFPFGIREFSCAKVLEFLGSDEVDYNSPLIATNMSSNEFGDIWTDLSKEIPRHDIVHFRNLTKFVDKGENYLLNYITSKVTGKSFSALLPGSFADYSKSLSKSMLKDNRRMIRRLKEKGNLEFQISRNENEFKEIVDKLIFQKEQRYKQTGARNIFLDNSVRKFYQKMYLLIKRGINIHLSTLSLDGEILATHLGIHYKDQFYYLMPTFNDHQKWEKFSLGRLHLEQLIHWAIENKIKRFDFTIGAESYKKIWCNDEMSIYSHLKLKSLRGLVGFTYFNLFEFIRSRKVLKRIVLKFIK